MKTDLRMTRNVSALVFLTLTLYLTLFIIPTAQGVGLQKLHGQVPSVVAHLRPLGQLPGTNRLNLAIGLPLRNKEALTELLRQIYDPASPNYHHYLTPGQFTERFGPTKRDYQALITFAKAHGLSVTATFPNRMVVDVSGSVSDIEKALNVTMRTYRHPNEKRMFYAPDTEPSLDLATPVLSISGLNNYSLPKPLIQERSMLQVNPASGSGPSGSYMGYDFRNAYVPGTPLNGSGQKVGLVEFGAGFNNSDITLYEVLAGLPTNIDVVPVLLDTFYGGPTYVNGNTEVSLDIEMVISMAPGISGTYVFEGLNTDSILSAMAASNQIQQLSASWLYPIDATTSNIFLQFAAQGQSFFNASGDSDAWTGSIPSPSDDPDITIVGGTTLTTSGAGGPWQSESVWNWGNEYGSAYDGIGSGGGTSAQYPIPYWQTNINMTANQGSTTMRNIPDVALTADDVFVVYWYGAGVIGGGTSCAAPLWAGFCALVNQQAAANNKPPVGFLNPAIYAIGTNSYYTNCFHDITAGDNTWSGSPSKFYAVTGYDLCTGWGTPAGQSLIDALAGPALPAAPVIFAQPTGCTNFVGATITFSAEAGGIPLPAYQWQFNGTNLAGETNTMLTLSNVQQSQAGAYAVLVTNTQGSVLSSSASLTLRPPPPIITTQAQNQTVVQGNNATFTMTATGTAPLNYQWQKNGFDLTNNSRVFGANSNTLMLTGVNSQDAGRYAVKVSDAFGDVTASSVFLTVLAPSCVVGWGFDDFGQADIPAGLTNVVAISAGIDNNLILNGDSTVAGWGLYYNTNANTIVPLGLTNVVVISASYYAYNLALKDDGTVVEWLNESNYTMKVVSGLSNVIAISAGEFHDLALKSNGRVVAWGDNKYGECAVPLSLTNVVAIAAGTFGSLALKADGTIVTWGGKFTPLDQSLNNLASLTNVVAVATEGVEGAALQKDGTVFAWQLGTFNGAMPVLTNAAAISCGYEHTLALMNNGTIVGWGDYASNNFGQLDIPWGLTNVVGISAGGANSLAFGNLPPAITRSPASQTVIDGDGVTFSATAVGIAPLTYQWQFNGQNIPDATNSTYSIDSTSAAEAGNYTIVVNNPLGSVTSPVATLAILPVQPIPLGGTFTTNSFSFNFTGPVGSQWVVYSSGDLADWEEVAGTTIGPSGTNSFTDDELNGASNRFYRLSNGQNCSPAFGFIQITVASGMTAIANQLDAPTNTLDQLFNPMPNGTYLPDGSQILEWNGTSFVTNTWSLTTHSWSPSGGVTLNPGEGAFVVIPTNNSPVTVTFMGLVPEGELTNSLVPGYNFVSSIVPQAGGLQSVLGYIPDPGDEVEIWNGTGYTGYSYILPTNGSNFEWYPSEPIINVGQSFFLDTTNNVWIQNLSPCSGNVCVAPTLFQPQITNNESSFNFNINGDPGAYWNVYESSNLVDWQLAGGLTLNSPAGTAFFTDGGVYGTMERYYKLSNLGCCSEVIGFVRVTAEPGITAIANQLDAPTNTLDQLFNPMPDGTYLPDEAQILKWNGTSFTTNTWSLTTHSWSPSGSVALNPGEGAFFVIPTNDPPIIVTFAGLVPENELTNSLAPGYNFVSSMVPQAGGIQSALGYNPDPGDEVEIWNGTGYSANSYVLPIGSTNFQWAPSEPAINVSQSFFLETTNSAWIQSFSPCSGNICGAPTLSQPQISVYLPTYYNLRVPGTFTFQINGVPATYWDVYESSDLINWRLAGGVTLDSIAGTNYFEDVDIYGVGHRFYKLSNGSCCSQVIGFVRMTIPPTSWALIANQLDAPTNTLDALFYPMPDGDIPGTAAQILKWNGAAYTTNTWTGSNWIADGSATLNPGEGAFYYNACLCSYPLAFAGLVPEGQLTIPLAPGYNLVSSVVPQAGGLQSALGYVPDPGDEIEIWNGTVFEVYNYFYPRNSTNSVWAGSEPVIGVGESFFLNNVSNNIWQVNFSACH